jgi:hypothetical protein
VTKLGIFIIGTPDQEVSVPPEYVTSDEICPNGGQTLPESSDQGGELALSLDLPPEYRFVPDDPDTLSAACDGVVWIVKRVYERVYERGGGGYILIARTRVTVMDGMHWPADRVKVVTIGGREAVLLEPVHPEGSEHGGTGTGIVFPEPFGMTFMLTHELPLVDVLELAEKVAEATKDDTPQVAPDPVSDRLAAGSVWRTWRFLATTPVPLGPAPRARMTAGCLTEPPLS